MWGRVLPLGQGVHEVLVFLAMVQTRHEIELVERATQEGCLGNEAGQTHIARGLQVNRVKGRGQIVGAIAGVEFAKGGSIGYGSLALVSKRQDRVTDLLDLRQPEARGADPR